MNLGLCIANLLRRYPAVEVPGIGVFKKTRMPASYDERKAAFLPPASTVELTGEDTDVFPLARYVQAQQQVDESTAIRMLDEAVKEIMETISRNGQALLDGLGYLMADGASFVFKPFATDGFGWKRIDAKPPLVTEELAEEGLDDGPVIGEAAADDIHPRKRSAIRWVIAAALLVVLGAGAALWYYQPTWIGRTAITPFSGEADEGEQRNQLANEDVELAADSLEASNVDSAKADTVQATAALADSMLVEPTAAAPIKAEKPSVTYEIIVGSFATMAQAKKFVAEMKAKGYDLHAIESRMPGNRKKVSWGSFATEEKAYRELARVQKNFEPGAWIAKVVHD